MKRLIKKWAQPVGYAPAAVGPDTMQSMPAFDAIMANDPYFAEVLYFVLVDYPNNRHVIVAKTVESARIMRISLAAKAAVLASTEKDFRLSTLGLTKRFEQVVVTTAENLPAQNFSPFNAPDLAVSCTYLLTAEAAKAIAYLNLDDTAPRHLVFASRSEATSCAGKRRLVTDWVLKYDGAEGKGALNSGSFYGGTGHNGMWNYHRWVGFADAKGFKSADAVREFKAKCKGSPLRGRAVKRNSYQEIPEE